MLVFCLLTRCLFFFSLTCHLSSNLFCTLKYIFCFVLFFSQRDYNLARENESNIGISKEINRQIGFTSMF